MGLFIFIFRFLFFTLDLFDVTKSAGYSRRSLFGGIKHYDKNGHQVGYSMKGFLGDMNRYDMKGKLVSTTRKGAFGEYKTFDANGKLVRTSRKNMFGGYTTYDSFGKQVGESYRNSLGEVCHLSSDEYAFDAPMGGIPKREAVEEFKRNNCANNRGISSGENTAKNKKSYSNSRNKDTINRNKKKKVKENNSYINNKEDSVKEKRTKEKSIKEDIIIEKDTTVEVNKTEEENTVLEGKSVYKAPLIKEISDDLDADCVEQYTKPNSDNGNNSDKMCGDNVHNKQKENIEFYNSVEEYVKDKNINRYAKILIFEYKDMKELPAIAHMEQNEVKVLPLVNNAKSFAIKKSDVKSAKRVCVEGIDMFTIDNEFYNLEITKLDSEFEELLPEYLFDRSGMKRIQYVFHNGLIITEKSMEQLKKLISY